MSPVVFSVVALGLVAGLVLLGRQLFRLARRATQARDEALDRLAAEMGALREPARPGRLTGAIGGRPCALWEISTVGASGSHHAVRIQVALTSATTLELYGQTSTLGARLVNDVLLGDPEFDRWFIVRTNDIAAVKAALSPETRRQLINGLRNGRIARVWTKDRHLWIDGGHGLGKKAHVERAAEVLRTALVIAGGLEAA